MAQILGTGVVAALVQMPILGVLVILAGPRCLVRAWWCVLGCAGSLIVVGAEDDPTAVATGGESVGCPSGAATATPAPQPRDEPRVPGVGGGLPVGDPVVHSPVRRDALSHDPTRGSWLRTSPASVGGPSGALLLLIACAAMAVLSPA